MKLIFFSLLSLIELSLANLICNGDFQGLKLTQEGLDSANKVQKFDYFNCNPLCWYTSTGAKFQVLQIKNGIYPTNVIDFVSLFSYNICQNISCQINAKYQLNYTFVHDQKLISASILALVDGKQIGRVTYKSLPLIKKTSLTFTATKNYHQICFQSLQTCPLLNVYCAVQYSPFLDNVTLMLIAHAPSNTSTLSNITTNATNITNTTNFTNSSTVTPTNQSSVTINNSSQIAGPNQTLNTTTNTDQIQQINSENDTIYPQVPVQNGPISIPIYFKSFANYLDNSFTLTSDFKLDMYGLTPRSFQGLIVSIKGQPQNNAVFSKNSEGYLEILFYPQYIIDILRLKDISVYYPKQLYQLQSFFRFQFYIDGRHLVYMSLSKQQYNNLGTIQSVSAKLASGIYSGFMILNSLFLSYLVINLIGFWNLCLMYSFLMIETVPMFAINFMNKLRDNLFLRSTFKFFIYKMQQLNSNNDLMSLQIFQSRQKIDRYKDQFQWFNYVGISSNPFNNNLDSFFLIGFFFFRYYLFKIIFYLLQLKFTFGYSFDRFGLLNRFIDQLSCFSPFIVISAIETLFDLAQTSFLPKVSSLIQINLLFAIIFLPMLNFTLKDHRIQRLHYPKNHRKILSKKYDIFDSCYWSLLCILIPLFIEFKTKLVFYIFIFITILIILRFYNLIRNKKYLFWKQLIFKWLSTSNWVIYHFTFIFYYILQYLPENQVDKIKNAVKYCGFIIIGCILFGAILDLVDFSINILIYLIWLLKKLFKFFTRNRKIVHHSSKVNLCNTDKNQQNKSHISQNLHDLGKTLVKINKDEFYKNKNIIKQKINLNRNLKTTKNILEAIYFRNNETNQTNQSFHVSINTQRRNKKRYIKQKLNKNINVSICSQDKPDKSVFQSD